MASRYVPARNGSRLVSCAESDEDVSAYAHPLTRLFPLILFPQHADMTASERLTIDEEYEAQQGWIDDPKSMSPAPAPFSEFSDRDG